MTCGARAEAWVSPENKIVLNEKLFIYQVLVEIFNGLLNLNSRNPMNGKRPTLPRLFKLCRTTIRFDCES